ncbi:MAG: hypothetical protein P4L85_15735 [Paludisphaera borealis]|uniref:hypothetical protein n=1 Tax=Paludisphaera borealis TaxID=1387353 RepID=UPI002849C8A9|nr:hypothetical protein [Paludisphaera borealis]MDR3620802.1 hypothetical protein [Paludisphaera borealis]
MPNAAETAATKLTSEMGSWTSIELRYHMDCENKDPARPSSYPRTFRITGRYIETAAGQRLLDERKTTDLKTNETTVQIEYSDGSKCASMLRIDTDGTPSREQVGIKRHFYLEDSGSTGRPNQLQYLYVGLKPLPEVLAQAEHLGEGRWLDRDCDRFLFTHTQGKQDPVNRIYWLDRETGVTLRLQYYETDQKRAEDRPYFAWNATSLDDVNGHHLTLNSELLQYDVEGSDPQRVLMDYKFTTDEAAFDRAYEKSMFWPTITKETTVIDTIKNTAVFPKKEAVEFPSTATPIRAVESSGWTDSLPTSAMLLGAAALVVGLLVRRRRG